MRWIWVVTVAALAAVSLLTAGCVLVPSPPKATSIDERLAVIPTDGLDVSAPVTVRWNNYQVPFIQAETDDDAAFALGLVHAHLRLGQMALFREIVNGRISEAVGPFAVEFDAAIRTFGFTRAVDEIYANMPPESRRWLERFTEGVNAYAARLPRKGLPHEMRLLDVAWTPWTPQDSIAVGRIAGIDINWGTWITFLGVEDKALREKLFRRLVERRAGGTDSFDLTGIEQTLDPATLKTLRQFAGFFEDIGKSGSNSVVVSAERSRTGGALIANDPHLGFTIPNVWVIVGIESPSFSITGMMPPGTPVIGFGRNRDIAWGGTNLRAETSEFVDVSSLPEDAFTTESYDIGVRFWFDAERTGRQSPYGPVMSDLELLPSDGQDFAVRWIGHTPTDEVTALYNAMKAASFEEFRAAMKTFAVPPQIFLVAEREGGIGGVIGTTVPDADPDEPFRILRTPEQSDRNWANVVNATELPFIYKPERGFIASANNRPASERKYLYDGFFPQDERIRRLRQILDTTDSHDLQSLTDLQMDTISLLSRDLVEAVADRLRAWTPRNDGERMAIDMLLAWDGDYDRTLKEPVVFEAFATAFAPAAYEAMGRTDEWELANSLRYGRVFLIEDLPDLSDEDWAVALAAGLEKAAPFATGNTAWGDIHKLQVRHLLGMVPLIGGRYQYDSIPVSGSQETILKTAHPETVEEHTSFYGAQSRHLSDMADPDENYFVLYGGQDGWVNSANMADQVDLWRRGEYVHVPLTREAVARAFPKVTTLRPR